MSRSIVIKRILPYHGIGPSKLAPNVSEDSAMRSNNVSRFQYFPPARIARFMFQSNLVSRRKTYNSYTLAILLDFLFNLLQFRNDERTVLVPMRMKARKNLRRLLPAILRRQPSRRPWHEPRGHQQDPSGNHLESPRQAERGRRAVDERRAVRDEVHDQDAPGDHPLLERNEPAAELWRADLGDVDWPLRREHAHGEPVDHASDDQHG